MAVVATLVLAGGAAAAVVAHAGRAGGAGLTGLRPPVAVPQATCRELVRRDKGAAGLAAITATVRVPDCLPGGNAGPGGFRLAVPVICIPLPFRAGYRAGSQAVSIRPGPHRRRCYPGLS